jgi:hypothetical protein
MSRIRLILVVSTFLFIALAPPAGATPISVFDGGMGGSTFEDLTFGIVAYGLEAYGYTSFPFLGNQLAAGHFNQGFPAWIYPELIVGDPPHSIRIELFFEPTDLLARSPFEPGVAGSSVTRVFTMTAVLTADAGNAPPIDFVGQGTFSAGWFPREGTRFGFQFFNAQFVPEPSSVTMLAAGFIAFLCIRKRLLRAHA